MESKDLMLGDLVTFKDCQNDDEPIVVKIWMINDDGEAFAFIDSPDALEEISIDDEIVGIPLTPEILEKNGFIIKHPESEKRTYWRDCAGQIVGHKNRGLMLMEIHGNPKKFGYFIPYFKGHLYYVHELQHALRLCGIDKEIEL